MFADFIGQSIVISHAPSDVLAWLAPTAGAGCEAGAGDDDEDMSFLECRCRPHGAQLLSVYAHLHAADEIAVGRDIAVSDVVGTVAPSKGKPGSCPAHLHLSLAWTKEAAAPPRSWRDLCSERFRFIPLPAPE